MAPQVHSTSGSHGFRNSYSSFKRNDSLELLNPPFDSPLRKTNICFATFNLVATIVGGGVLSLPMAFAKAGLVLATFMMIFSAVITDFSLYILCCCARRTGSATYMDVVRFAFGPMAEIYTTGALWIFLSGVLVAFNVLLKDIFAPLAKDFVSTFEIIDFDSSLLGRNFDALVLLCILMLVSPLMMKRNLYALRHICYVGFTSVCVIMISIGVRAFQRNQIIVATAIDESKTLPLAGLIGDNTSIKLVTNSWKEALFAFPIIVLAFLCSFNMVEVHGALENPTRHRVKSAIHTAIASCFVLFQAFGLAGYFYAYDACKGNIFLNFDPSDSLIIFGRLGMGLTLTFATPVVTLPCREALLQLISQTLILWRKPHEELKSFASPEGAPLTRSDEFKLDVTVEKGSYSTFGEDHIHDLEMDTKSTDDDEAHTPKEDDQRDDRHPMVHIGATLMITVYAFFTAVSVPGVAVVWSVLGSSLGMVIGFIIPCACYLKIRGKKGMMRNKSIGAMALLIFSIVVAILCTVQTSLGFL